MVLSINIMHGPGLNSKMHTLLQPKETKVRLYLIVVDIAAKALYTLYISTTDHFSFKSRCVVRVAKHLEEDWFRVF